MGVRDPRQASCPVRESGASATKSRASATSTAAAEVVRCSAICVSPNPSTQRMMIQAACVHPRRRLLQVSGRTAVLRHEDSVALPTLSEPLPTRCGPPRRHQARKPKKAHLRSAPLAWPWWRRPPRRKYRPEASPDRAPWSAWAPCSAPSPSPGSSRRSRQRVYAGALRRGRHARLQRPPPPRPPLSPLLLTPTLRLQPSRTSQGCCRRRTPGLGS